MKNTNAFSHQKHRLNTAVRIFTQWPEAFREMVPPPPPPRPGGGGGGGDKAESFKRLFSNFVSPHKNIRLSLPPSPKYLSPGNIFIFCVYLFFNINILYGLFVLT